MRRRGFGDRASHWARDAGPVLGVGFVVVLFVSAFHASGIDRILYVFLLVALLVFGALGYALVMRLRESGNREKLLKLIREGAKSEQSSTDVNRED